MAKRYWVDSDGLFAGVTTDGETRPNCTETAGPPLTPEALAAALEKKGTLTKGEIDAEKERGR